LVTAVAGKLVQVFQIFFTSAGATNLTFKDGTGGTALTGAMSFTTNQQFSLVYDTTPHFFASPGNAFVLNSSTGVQISGVIWFTQR
jgi:hypothetical protein